MVSCVPVTFPNDATGKVSSNICLLSDFAVCVLVLGGYSDTFIHTEARSFFEVQNFEFQYFWGFSEK